MSQLSLRMRMSALAARGTRGFRRVSGRKNRGGDYSEASGGDAASSRKRPGAERDALILRAVAAYQGSFWKLILRGRRVLTLRELPRDFAADLCRT